MSTPEEGITMTLHSFMRKLRFLICLRRCTFADAEETYRYYQGWSESVDPPWQSPAALPTTSDFGDIYSDTLDDDR